MNGNDMSCGAASGLKSVKNPIKLARKVMEKTCHVWLAGEGAERFAKEQDIEFADLSYFFTQRRYDQYLDALRQNKVVQDHSGSLDRSEGTDKKGTVGCVAVDQYGNLAAATSTGGRTNKMFGRVGDSPIIGAGTFANDICAVSGTGWGEKFIKHSVAHHINCLIEYKNMSLQEAADFVVHKKLDVDDGGVVAVSKDYEIAMPYNTIGMFRASASHNSETIVKIWE
jgi:beta-aspartyl-peptidase (threonine type)